MKRALLLFICVVYCAVAAEAEVRLPDFFNDGMVLQCDMEVPVWGWGEAGEKVTVEFANQKVTTTVDEFGSWMLHLKPMKANAKGCTLVIRGQRSEDRGQAEIKNVLVGEVWLCSGTINMDIPMRKSRDSGKVIKASANAQLRICKIKREQSPLPENNVYGDWQPCGPQSLSEFSAVGYYFAKKLQEDLGVPVGIIQASWGGTGMNPWIPAEGYRDTLKFAVDDIYGGRPSSKEGKAAWEKYLKDLADWLPKAKKAVANGEIPVDKPEPPSKLWITNIVPTKTFNGMIHPLIPYAIRGVIWDETESLARRPKDCASRYKALITSWRKLWNHDFSFYFVQAADPKLAELREQQQKCLEIKNTGMARIGEIAEGADQNVVGARLAVLALSRDYE